MMENKNRYYVNNGSIVPLEDLQPAEYIIGSAGDLTVLVGKVFPGSIARIAGTKTWYEMKPNGEWSNAHNEESGDFAPDISNPQDGDTLVYDGTEGKWVNGAASGGGGGVLYVESVDDTLDKNYTEITQAIADGKIVAGITNDDGINIQYLAAAYEEDSKYYVLFKSGTLSGLYVADTATGTLTLDVGN